MLFSDINFEHSVAISGRQSEWTGSQHRGLRSPDMILFLNKVVGPDLLVSLYLKQVFITVTCVSLQESTTFRNNELSEGIL